MTPRTIYFVSYRESSRQRAHFAIWIPYADDGKEGTQIHVVGAPMSGFCLEFKRKFDYQTNGQADEVFAIGQIDSQHVHDWTGDTTIDSTPWGNLERVASQIPPPRASKNFMAPVNETTNRRCQEWTMDFVRRLAEIGYLESNAATIVQSKRDLPSHGIVGLRVGAAALE